VLLTIHARLVLYFYHFAIGHDIQLISVSDAFRHFAGKYHNAEQLRFHTYFITQLYNESFSSAGFTRLAFASLPRLTTSFEPRASLTIPVTHNRAIQLFQSHLLHAIISSLHSLTHHTGFSTCGPTPISTFYHDNTLISPF
jgi:hypothetical protein